MNKKFKLTDKVTKESIRSPEFKRWMMRTLAVVCIISLIFQFSTCVFQGLCAYAADDPVESSAIGTWILNDTIAEVGITGISYFNVNLESNGETYPILAIYGATTYQQNAIAYCQTVNNQNIVYNGYWLKPLYKTVTITGGTDINNVLLLNWLNANGVKQAPSIVYDFTNEIRVFNDNLTFFITNSTTWTEAFNFNFEVIGVGTADYIVLQRDVNNNYTMSYSYDFEGSGGLRTVYRFNHTTDTGGFFKENTKYIRFINNPENTDFQQWLLDNTTLVGTSDDIESFDTFYDMGFNVGYNSGYEQGFANSLIGDSLSGPINALSSITLIQIGDTVITLGGLIMTAIALCLVLAFLKLYAGG